MKGNLSDADRRLLLEAEKLTEALRYVRFAQHFPNQCSFSLGEVRETTLAKVVRDLFVINEGSSQEQSAQGRESVTVYKELSALSTLVDCIPSLRVLSGQIGTGQTGATRMSRRDAFEGLSDSEVVREFSWRINELVSGVYKLLPAAQGS
jgi:hypothetical protein